VRRESMPESERRSFWDRAFSTSHETAREEKVAQYIIHRVGEGAHLADVVQEEYVRRNASPSEVEEICAKPALVHAAREHMHRDFSSEEFDPSRRPR